MWEQHPPSSPPPLILLPHSTYHTDTNYVKHSVVSKAASGLKAVGNGLGRALWGAISAPAYLSQRIQNDVIGIQFGCENIGDGVCCMRQQFTLKDSFGLGCRDALLIDRNTVKTCLQKMYDDFPMSTADKMWFTLGTGIATAAKLIIPFLMGHFLAGKIYQQVEKWVVSAADNVMNLVHAPLAALHGSVSGIYNGLNDHIGIGPPMPTTDTSDRTKCPFRKDAGSAILQLEDRAFEHGRVLVPAAT